MRVKIKIMDDIKCYDIKKAFIINTEIKFNK